MAEDLSNEPLELKLAVLHAHDAQAAFRAKLDSVLRLVALHGREPAELRAHLRAIGWEGVLADELDALDSADLELRVTRAAHKAAGSVKPPPREPGINRAIVLTDPLPTRPAQKLFPVPPHGAGQQ